MRINSLKNYGFRNLKKLELDFAEDTNVFGFVGANGQGKTNLLEAIFLLSASKSFRTRENQDLISFDLDFCRLDAKITTEEGDSELAFVVTEKPAKKTLKINDVIKTAKDYIGLLKVVFFSPDDMGMIHLSPSLRRRYLDLLISQIDRDYLDHLMAYQHVIKQRNSLLKSIKEGSAKEEELQFWNQEAARHGFIVVEKRESTLKKLGKIVKKLYKEISKEGDELVIEYVKSGAGETEADLLKSIEDHQKSDLILGNSRIGPHRDDLKFMCNTHDLAHFGSRGEWRSLILALKFAELQLIEEVSGEKPVLLLDDVFSELDEDRQRYLFNAISGVQTFISTTHKEFLDVIEAKVQLYSVENGEVLTN